jgi:hypothetical protein
MPPQHTVRRKRFDEARCSRNSRSDGTDGPGNSAGCAIGTCLQPCPAARAPTHGREWQQAETGAQRNDQTERFDEQPSIRRSKHAQRK